MRIPVVAAEQERRAGTFCDCGTFPNRTAKLRVVESYTAAMERARQDSWVYRRLERLGAILARRGRYRLSNALFWTYVEPWTKWYEAVKG